MLPKTNEPGWTLPVLSLRQVVQGTVVVTAVAALFWLLYRFHLVFLLLIAAVIISTALKPIVNWLQQRGVSRSVGILLIYGMMALLLGILGWYSAPIIAGQGSALSQSLDQGYTAVVERLGQVPNFLLRRLAAILPSDLSALTAVSTETDLDAEATLQQMQSQAGAILTQVSSLVAVFILAFYWTLEGERIKQSAFLLAPMHRRVQIRELVQQIETKISHYLLGQGALCLIIGFMAFVAYLLIGLPHALLLALFAGLMEAVPIIGPFIGAVPAILVGLTVSPETAVWVVVATIVMQQLENSFLVPRVMKRAVGVSPLVTLLALLGLGTLFGVLGALIALPLATVAHLLLDRFLAHRENGAEVTSGRDRLGVLHYQTDQLVHDVRQHIRHKQEVPTAADDEWEDAIEGIAQDLATFLAAQNNYRPDNQKGAPPA